MQPPKVTLKVKNQVWQSRGFNAEEDKITACRLRIQCTINHFINELEKSGFHPISAWGSTFLGMEEMAQLSTSSQEDTNISKIYPCQHRLPSYPLWVKRHTSNLSGVNNLNLTWKKNIIYWHWSLDSCCLPQYRTFSKGKKTNLKMKSYSQTMETHSKQTHSQCVWALWYGTAVWNLASHSGSHSLPHFFLTSTF